jgi:hypothetical protein
MAGYPGDGYKEAIFAVGLLWAGVVLGVIALGLRAYLASQTGLAALPPLLIGTLVFIFIQSRLIIRLAARNGAVRQRIFILAILRFALFLPNLQQTLNISLALVIIPAVAVLLQLIAMLLVYTSPGRDWFIGGR